MTDTWFEAIRVGWQGLLYWHTPYSEGYRELTELERDKLEKLQTRHYDEEQALLEAFHAGNP